MNKFNDVKNILSKYYSGVINLNLSPATSYRSRCEFGYRNGKYTMVKGDKKIQVSFQLSKERPCSLNGACLQLNSEWTDTEDCLIPINEWIKD